jgi:hypothetical protein
VKSRSGLVLIVSIAVTVLLYVVPYGHVIAYPLMLISTLVHELGHGIAGVMVGGNFQSFEMWSNGAGLAHVVGYDGRFARAFVSAGGLCGPAVAAAVGFVMARGPRRSKWMLGTLGVLLVIADVWIVRSLFGWLFVTLFAAMLLAIAFKASAHFAQMALMFLSVQLSLSVFSRGDYLFTSVANTGAGTFPSDVANMSDALFLPYWFWGAVCGAFSVLVLAVGGWLFLRAMVSEGELT